MNLAELKLTPETALKLTPEAALKIDGLKLSGKDLLLTEEKSFLSGLKGLGRGAKTTGILGLTVLGVAATEYAVSSLLKPAAKEADPTTDKEFGKSLDLSKKPDMFSKDHPLNFEQMLRDSSISRIIDDQPSKADSKHDPGIRG